MLHRKPLFLSVETDGEFRARIKQENWLYLHATGEELDAKAWDYFKKQRRLIERSG